MRRTVYTAEHEAFRGRVRQFLQSEAAPHYSRWERDGMPPRGFWRGAGELGILGIGVPARYGGLDGSSFKHSAIVTEEVNAAGMTIGGLRLQVDICMPYLLELTTEEQRRRWLPGLTSGELGVAIAISEPGAGSDMKAMATRAVRDGDRYLVNGTKTFISSGATADLIILAAKTDPAAGRRGISLLVVEAGSPGFSRGRRLEKIGQKAQDVSELFFADVEVPAENLLGEENHGFEYLTANLAQERLSIAVNAQAAAAASLHGTAERIAGDGAANGAGQHAKFELAACAAEVEAGQALTDAALEAHERGELDPADAAMVKLFCTELQGRVVERCLELHGLDGYARTSPIGRAFADARVSRIYGGSSEIMKVIVAKSMEV